MYDDQPEHLGTEAVRGDDRPAGGSYADDLYGARARGRAATGLAAPPAAGAHRRRRERRRHRRLTVLAVILAALLVAVGLVYSWARGQISPGGKPGPVVTVVIPKGATTTQIGQRLAAAGVIHGSALFPWYVKLEGDGPFDAGTYRLATNESYAEAVHNLEKPPVVLSDRLTIPEGFTVRQIAASVGSLPGMHLSAAAFDALSTSGSVRSLYEPAKVDNLEGLLFPATYQIARTDSATTVMDLLVQTFVQRAQGMGLAEAAAKLKVTPYDVVKVASIVQGEAKFTSQFPDVASVIYNRLRSGMTLGDDSTLIYALRQKNPNLDPSKVNYEQRNPYNTRINRGLPPTPIDNPGAAALEAAMHPPHTNLLYFVEIDKAGKLAFATNISRFDQLAAQCRAQGLC